MNCHIFESFVCGLVVFVGCGGGAVCGFRLVFCCCCQSSSMVWKCGVRKKTEKFPEDNSA